MGKTQRVAINGQTIGVVRWGQDSDFPWAKGSFEPIDGFEAFERFFKRNPQPHNASGRWLQDEQLAAEGIGADKLLLIGEDEDEPSFIHALVLHDDGRAAWRFGDEPLV